MRIVLCACMQSSTPPASPNLSKFVTYEEGVYFHIVLERGKELTKDIKGIEFFLSYDVSKIDDLCLYSLSIT